MRVKGDHLWVVTSIVRHLHVEANVVNATCTYVAANTLNSVHALQDQDEICLIYAVGNIFDTVIE